jgi:hypothetical protein
MFPSYLWLDTTCAMARFRSVAALLDLYDKKSSAVPNSHLGNSIESRIDEMNEEAGSLRTISVVSKARRHSHFSNRTTIASQSRRLVLI